GNSDVEPTRDGEDGGDQNEDAGDGEERIMHGERNAINSWKTDYNLGGTGEGMPRISQFYGIALYMYYRDHAPPHFHAIYGEHEAVFEIASGTVIAGQLPRRAQTLVEDWLAAHRPELQ